MGEQIKPEEMALQQGPAKAAWEKYRATGNAFSDPVRVVFATGWNSALAWIPFRIQQFREIEAELRKEIEILKQKVETSDGK